MLSYRRILMLQVEIYKPKTASQFDRKHTENKVYFSSFWLKGYINNAAYS